MDNIFRESKINNAVLSNRLIRSATWEGMCDNTGAPTEKLIKFYEEMINGGIGLIITGYQYVKKDGQQLPGQIGIHDDSLAKSHKNLTRRIHESKGKIFAQLVHCGGQSNSKSSGFQPSAPSALKSPQYPEAVKELTEEEIEILISSFTDAAMRTKEWGYDGIQLHAAHGYLINQFLSPNTNKRNDRFGGTLHNRARFLYDIYENIREKAGKEFPIIVKLNGSDNLDGGFELDEAVKVAEKLDEMGIDAIEVSGGTPASGEKTPVRTDISESEKEGYNMHEALKIKENVSCPVISVGGFRSYKVVEKALEQIDFVSMARPLICEADLPNIWKRKDKNTSDCISCNGCFRPGLKEGGIRCIVKNP
ncbi:NADH:flavin oxidoreductase [Flexistipes sp.]|uniref:NADH:flavin oxidoreductase n=1 Tax=Flexistipes sp. TaxID=3088135 RepID=UPI002E1BBE7F|nr:NADH:flavin oxidoreductase [Flexistipes sp.]